MLPSCGPPAPGAQAAGPGSTLSKPQRAVRCCLLTQSPKPGTPYRPIPRPELRTRTGHTQKALMDTAALHVPRNLKAGTDPRSLQGEKEAIPLVSGAERRRLPFKLQGTIRLFRASEIL